MRPGPPTRTILWLTLCACLLAAVVPSGGITLCVDAEHLGIGHGRATTCPCDDHPLAPDDGHRDVALEATDFGRPQDESARGALAPAEAIPPVPARAPLPCARPPARPNAPTDPPEPPRLIVRRTVVLLI